MIKGFRYTQCVYTFKHVFTHSYPDCDMVDRPLYTLAESLAD